MREKKQSTSRWLRYSNSVTGLRSKTDSRNVWASAIVALACAAIMGGTAAAQPVKVQRIAYLSAGSAASQASRLAAFKQGLRSLGYADGKDLVVEERYADGNLDRTASLAAELISQKVAVIVTGGPAATRAVKQATTSIPIVMAFDWDPVASGMITSLARPGGNITGLSALTPEITGKQLELLKEVVPRMSRVAILENSTEPGFEQVRKELEQAAGAFKVRSQFLDVRAPKDLAMAFEAANKDRADALLAVTSFILISQRAQIGALAAKNHLPAIYPWPEFVDDGGLMSYSASSNDLFRRAATFIDKILKGTKPFDLPVEQPVKFEFIVNLKAAKQIGLTLNRQ